MYGVRRKKVTSVSGQVEEHGLDTESIKWKLTCLARDSVGFCSGKIKCLARITYISPIAAEDLELDLGKQVRLGL